MSSQAPKIFTTTASRGPWLIWGAGGGQTRTVSGRRESIAAFVAAFGESGFVPCDDSRLEEGCEKLAIYTVLDNVPTHVARQLQAGLWTSKLGQLQDIQHRLEDLVGSLYGQCQHFLKRERSLTS
jgi:hypothetical protein